MSLKSSMNYLEFAKGIALFNIVQGSTKDGNLARAAKCKEYRKQGKSLFLYCEPAAVKYMFRVHPELFRIEEFLGWEGKKNVIDVVQAAKEAQGIGYKVYIDFLPIDYKEIPSSASRGKSVALENMVAERLTALTGCKWERVGDKRRGAHGSYHPDVECAETGETVEVKGCGSVFSCKAARDVHQHGAGEEE